MTQGMSSISVPALQAFDSLGNKGPVPCDTGIGCVEPSALNKGMLNLAFESHHMFSQES